AAADRNAAAGKHGAIAASRHATAAERAPGRGRRNRAADPNDITTRDGVTTRGGTRETTAHDRLLVPVVRTRAGVMIRRTPAGPAYRAPHAPGARAAPPIP